MHLSTLSNGVLLSLALTRLARDPRSPLTPNAQQEEFIAAPRFTPDGKRVIFAYRREASTPTQIHSIGLDGADEKTLTADSNSVVPVAFSPDGKRLVYRAENRDSRGFLAADRAQRRTRFMSSKPDGSDPRALLSITGGPASFLGWWANGTKAELTAADTTYVMELDGSNRQIVPAGQLWLRDGELATIKSDLTSSTIIVSGANGEHPHPLATDVRYQSRPIVSNDGRRIAFVGGSVPPMPRLGAGVAVYAVNTDGSGLHQILSNAARAYNFEFSPDGSKIVFEDTRDENTDIYVVDVDGKNERRLTTDPGHDELPSWSPDGHSIVFHRDVRGIYIMNADGTGTRRLR